MIYLSQTDNTAGKEGLTCSGEGQFGSFFHTFGIKEGNLRKMTCRWEKARWGWDYRTVDKNMCFIEGS